MVTGVKLEGLSKSFGDVKIIPGLNLDIQPGEFVALLGPSGCGKTTVLRMIAGLDNPDRGSISIGSEVVFEKSKGTNVPPEKRNLGMVFQSYAIWPHMTVLENVAFGLRCKGIKLGERRRQSLDWLDRVKMVELANRMPNQLSGGQQQRVALARALASRPRILLMDEPLSNLDANLRVEMVGELQSLKKQMTMTVVYVTHDHQEATALSNRLAVMNHGQIEQYDNFPNIMQSPANEFVRRFFGFTSL